MATSSRVTILVARLPMVRSERHEGVTMNCTVSAALRGAQRVGLAMFVAVGIATASAGTVDSNRDIQAGFTSDGAPFRGNPDASVTLVEYTDYACPFCEMFFRQTLPALLEKYVRAGQVKLVVKDLPLPSLHPTAPKVASAALCAAEQGPRAFWAMHDAIFRAQQQWNHLSDPGDFLGGLAEQAGLDRDGYRQCVASGRTQARTRSSAEEAQKLGFTGTPSFQFVKDGKSYPMVGAQPSAAFEQVIDALLAGNEPPKAKEPEKPELPLWAKREGLVPDPKRPGYTAAGDPYRGNPSAKVVVVEFEDYECPSCERHAMETQPVLDKKFVDSGDVLWVAKQYPLRMHRYAPAAASAAKCAGDQGNFWAMRRLLFANVESWSKATDPDAALLQLAKRVPMNQAAFRSCLSGRKSLERVLADLYDGLSVGVRSVPSFVILRGGDGTVLVGARTVEEFSNALQQELAKSTEEPAPQAAVLPKQAAR